MSGSATNSAAAYPVIDSLHNFRIKARLERIGTVSGNLPSFAAFVSDTGDGRLLGSSANAGSEVEEVTFRWQQKIFSPREYALYGNAANCATPLQQQYNRDIIEIRNGEGRVTERLFTYVEGDDLPDNIVSRESLGQRRDSAVAERISNVRNRKVTPQSRLPSTALINPISDIPSAELIKRSRSVAVSSKVMYIMAYLGPKDVQEFDKIDASDEKVLCTIRLINDCQLILTPDFNESQKPYRLESRMGVFNFILSDASPKLSSDAIEDERNRIAKLTDYRSTLMTAKIGTAFDVPEDGVLKTLVLINIQKAYNFEFDGLFVHYLVDLPRGWYTSTPEALEGVTQTCSTASIDQENVANFSVPVEVDLCYKWNLYEEESGQERAMTPGWPQLLLCVGSMDEWSRYRAEGYAFVQLPSQPGHKVVDLHTWRPIAGRVDQLRRFFIGGSAELESLDTISVPAEDIGNKLSRLGLQTAASGIVTVEFRVVHQCRSYIAPERQRQIKYGALLERIGATGTGGMHWSIIAVLEAFEKARRRMLQARDQFFYVNQSFDSRE